MGLSINSHAVLRSFAEYPDIFPAIQPDLAELARKLLLKQLKAKSTDAALLRKLFEVTGADTLSTIFDGMMDSEIITLIKKVDPYSAYGKAGSEPGGARSHVIDLAAGRVGPSIKPAKVAAPKKLTSPKAPSSKAPSSKIGDILGSKVHSGATRKSGAKPRSE
jgi:hypothetical protein